MKQTWVSQEEAGSRGGGLEGTVSHSLSAHAGSCALLLVSQALVEVPARLFAPRTSDGL